MIYITADLMCLLILVVLALSGREFKTRDNSRRSFSMFLLMAILQIAVDAIWAAVAGKTGIYLSLGWLLNTLYFCFSGFLGYAAILWLSSECPNSPIKGIISKVTVLPAVLLAVLSLASNFTGWIFWLDDMGVYHRGPVYWVHLLLAFGPGVAFTVHLLMRAVQERHTIQRRKFLILASFTAVLYVGEVLQVLVPQAPMMNYGMVVATVWVYVRLQNQLISQDALTGLNNRYQLDNYLYSILSGNRDNKGKYYLLMLDIDRFKTINDKFGHLEGDHALQITAEIFKSASRTVHPFLARFGGDEFAIVMETQDVQEAESYRDLLQRLAALKSIGLPYELSFSIGIAPIEPGSTVQKVIAAADVEMYQVKNKRKDN